MPAFREIRALRPVLLAGLTTSSSHRVGGAAGAPRTEAHRNMAKDDTAAKARTLAPHVSLFLVRQVGLRT